MDQELKDLLAKASELELSPQEIEEGRVALAAANGSLSNDRITLRTMQATRVLMEASEKKPTK